MTSPRFEPSTSRIQVWSVTSRPTCSVVPLETCIREVLSSNLRCNIGYTDWGFAWASSAPAGAAFSVGHDRRLAHPVHFAIHWSSCYAVAVYALLWNTDSVVQQTTNKEAHLSEMLVPVHGLASRNTAVRTSHPLVLTTYSCVTYHGINTELLKADSRSDWQVPHSLPNLKVLYLVHKNLVQ
jgi:hypothetical protein